MSDSPGTWSHFRLNFEQQPKRAKDLLKAARAGDAPTLARFQSHPPRLAEAQYLIARESRCGSWAELKAHIAAMQREQQLLGSADALDADLRTLHIRCGSDIRQSLQVARLHGEFLEYSYSCQAGPVREEPDALLHESANYERVVIWSEFDCHDQLVLVRLLGHYATHPCPARLELINAGAWPGGMRFIGLGQLPPEALRMLWPRREPATTAQLSLGLAAWKALISDDPRTLAQIMRTDTPALSLLAPALHRHLQELPSVFNGLGLTQQLALAMLAEGPCSLQQIFGRMNYLIDPLPGQGDLLMRDHVLPMGAVAEPLFTRQDGVDSLGRARPPWTDLFSITGAGRAALRGELDFLSVQPPSRWVGGVQIGAGQRNWRWDERRRAPLMVRS
jgi:hypothetical protein